MRTRFRTATRSVAPAENVNVVLPVGGAHTHTDRQAADPVTGRPAYETFLTRGLPPPIDWARRAMALHSLDRTIEGDPRHDLGMREVPAWSSDFPDSFVRLPPCRLEMFQQGPLERPRIAVARQTRAARHVERVHDLAVHIQLTLCRRGISDPHRSRALIAREPWQLQLRKTAFAPHAIHDVERRRITRHGAQ